jgi:hypothetical protein
MSAAAKHSTLIPLLRRAINEQTLSPVRGVITNEEISLNNRLIGELFGLLVSDVSLENSHSILILVSSLIRELSLTGQVPKFFNKGLSTYSPERLVYLLPLLRELGFGQVDPETNPLAKYLSLPKISIVAEAFASVVHFGYSGDPAIDDWVISIMTTRISSRPVNSENSILKRALKSVAGQEKGSSVPVEIDGTPATEFFTPLIHQKNFDRNELLNIFVFSFLDKYLENRFFAHNDHSKLLSAPPNSPVSEARSPQLPLLSYPGNELIDAVVAVSIRILGQAQREVADPQKKAFKYMPTETNYTRDLVESTVVQTIRCLDVVCRKDPTRVSIVFPHIRKVYERVVQRPDSPGIAVTEVLKFFINHSHHVIFDIEPVLKYYLSIHLCRITSHFLVMETTMFLLDYAPTLCQMHSGVFIRHFPAILRIVAWYPRSAGTELVSLIPFLVKASSPILVDLFNTILDLPLIAGMLEASMDVEHYIVHDNSTPTVVELNPELANNVADPGTDQFVHARIFMKLIRSSEFRDILDYVNRCDVVNTKSIWTSNRVTNLLIELWKGIPLTPRVSAASQLVPRYLSVFFDEVRKSPRNLIFQNILHRFGNSKIFLFKPEISQLLIQSISGNTFGTCLPADIVTAILERVVDGGTVRGESLAVHLVHLIGESDDDHNGENGMYVKMLRFLLTSSLGCFKHKLSPSFDIVYIEKGRVVQRPDIGHTLLDQMITGESRIRFSQELVCMTISALTKISAKCPQYRPQTIELLRACHEKSDVVVTQRILESISLLQSYHLSRELVCSGA